MQILEVLAQREFVSAGCHAHSNAHKARAINIYLYAKYYLSRTIHYKQIKKSTLVGTVAGISTSP